MVPVKLSRLERAVTNYLGDRHLAVERLNDYCADLRAGLVEPVRLADFLSGLYAAGCWDMYVDADIHNLFSAAFPEA
ncbi:hypothetical protein [Corynebacterium sp.]|uniref:hypothetical protein n=1 Tax=Corynebacterium sp. TaxID=1720 RepID=UPI0028FEA205|nr:hypothetical protein [Corynebacterium sp.]MDU3111035.1 hypothetical protein [Corynebacterium sp.]